jgi:hypothetical protein
MSTEQALGSVLARLEGALNKTPAAAAPPCNTTAAATAPSQQDPLSGLSAQFLQQVLSLTNYSQLGSAPLLDPLIPSKNYQQMHAVLRQQQTLFCRWVPLTGGLASCCSKPARSAEHESPGMCGGKLQVGCRGELLDWNNNQLCACMCS